MSSTKTISYDLRIRLFWLIVSLISVAFVLYVYAIHATTRHIAEMGTLGQEIASLSAQQGTLEFTYIELKNKITLDTAAQYGLAEVQTPIYVSRSHSATLTLATRAANR